MPSGASGGLLRPSTNASHFISIFDWQDVEVLAKVFAGNGNPAAIRFCACYELGRRDRTCLQKFKLTHYPHSRLAAARERGL
jgi:hypothetical protein